MQKENLQVTNISESVCVIVRNDKIDNNEIEFRIIKDAYHLD